VSVDSSKGHRSGFHYAIYRMWSTVRDKSQTRSDAGDNHDVMRPGPVFFFHFSLLVFLGKCPNDRRTRVLTASKPQTKPQPASSCHSSSPTRWCARKPNTKNIWRATRRCARASRSTT